MALELFVLPPLYLRGPFLTPNADLDCSVGSLVAADYLEGSFLRPFSLFENRERVELS